MELFGACRFKTGDVAYYRSPESKYSVRKAKVRSVEKKERRVDRLFFPYYVITLEKTTRQLPELFTDAFAA